MNVVYYVANADCSQIKIGYSSNLSKRLYDLDLAHGGIALLGWEPGSKDVERLRHDAFNEVRLRGEWFSASDNLVEFVRALPSGIVVEKETAYLTIRSVPVDVFERLKRLAKSRRISVNSLCANTLEDMVAKAGEVV